MKVRSQNSNALKASTTAKQVDVSVLTVGMKIVGIEKPWSERSTQNTGFTITGTAELEHLKAAHKTVYIDPRCAPEPMTGDAGTSAQADQEDRPIVLWESNSEEEEDGEREPSSVWQHIQRTVKRLTPLPLRRHKL